MRAKLLTIRDVADRLRVSERTVRRWIANGDLAVLRPGASGRLVRIDPDDLSRFLHRAPVGRSCP